MPGKTSSAQKLLPRKPRVQIEYEVETLGGTETRELPWVTGVMADLSGANAGNLPELKDRKFSRVDQENFDEFMKDQKPRLNFAVEDRMTGEGRLGIDVILESMEDFSPDQFARKVGSETVEIPLVEEGRGPDRRYVLDPECPETTLFGASVTSLDIFSTEFVAYKMGEKPGDIEVQILPDMRDDKKNVLRITKKGPLAKLLDERTRLKELLINVDGKRDIQKALEGLLADKDAMEASLQQMTAHAEPQDANSPDSGGSLVQETPEAPPQESSPPPETAVSEEKEVPDVEAFGDRGVPEGTSGESNPSEKEADGDNPGMETDEEKESPQS